MQSAPILKQLFFVTYHDLTALCVHLLIAWVESFSIYSDKEASWIVDENKVMMNFSFVLNANTNFQGS